MGDRLRALDVGMDPLAYAHERGRPPGRIAKPEWVTWKLRIAVERGLLEPAPVNAASLPPGSPELATRVYERFLFLLRCRWLHTPREPAPYTRKFAAAWAGVTVDQARDAIDWLRASGYLKTVGKVGRAYLYMPAVAPHERTAEWAAQLLPDAPLTEDEFLDLFKLTFDAHEVEDA